VDQSVISRAARVAEGRFAPGHLGELTQQVPFEMVDAVLAETRRLQQRVRDLPARVVVYLVLAGCLFPELGYARVWGRLVAGLPGRPARPTDGAMRQARARLGPEPLRALFALLKGPAPVPSRAAGVRWKGLLPVAVDGTIMTVADTTANLAVYPRHKGGRNGGSSYPQLRLVALVSCGTRSVIDAAFGPASTGEIAYASCLLGALRAGMLLLADRGFGYGILASRVAATGAGFLLRVRAGASAAKLPVMQRCPDGSWLSLLGGVPVRVIDAQVTITTAAGSSASSCRLVTTLLDPAAYPARDVVALYRQRWEAETAYFELKSTILGGRVLRARTPAGVDQEVHALLVTYQALRTAIADAAATVPGADPDRASFSIALDTARDQVILAAGVTTATTAGITGRIGERVLASPMPARRLRTSPRVVKRAMSKYNATGKPDRATRNATINVEICAAPLTGGNAP
jgi:hypothetical protein